MRSRNLVIRYINAILDIFAMLIAYIIANKIKFGWWRTGIRNEANSYMTLFMIFLAAYFIVLLMFFAYDNMLERGAIKELFAVTKMLAYMTLIVTLYIYVTKTNDFYSRVHMAYFLGMSYVFVYVERQILKYYLTKSYYRSGATEKIILVTTSDQVEEVVKKIKETKNWYFRINSIALLDCNQEGELIDGIEVIAGEEDLLPKIATSENDGAFLCIPQEFPFAYTEFIDEMQEMGKQVHWNIVEYGVAGGAKEIQFLGKYPTVTWSNKNYRIRYKAIKRTIDIVIGLLGSLILLVTCPLVMIGHAIERDNGHIILGYVRVGKNGRRFFEYRFRVMKRNSSEVSKTGKILEFLGISNLPMAWNILWGDMSIVGVEAPSLPQFLAYSRNQRRGLSAQPGVIQFWPAYYWTRKNNEDITVEKCESEYVEHWSLWLDVKVVLRTWLLFCINREFRTHVRMRTNGLQQEERRILDEFNKDEEALEFEGCIVYKRRIAYHTLKRLFDVVVSLISLIILSPLLLILAVIVRMEDGQNVFYKQLRIGKDGEKIYVYKIRTMKTNVGDLKKILTPEQYDQYQKEFKIENDPRVTRVGRVLRKTSLDELPQLLNILKGELSIVGPRPIVEKETSIYGYDLGKLLSVKPGLTGYWQAYARNKATYESGERQQMELYYVEHQSIWLDIKILFRTIRTVLKRDGAM